MATESTNEVLLVEDDKHWQADLKEALEEAGYAVSVAGTYDDAVEALKRNSAKVAIVDISLMQNVPGDRQGRSIMEMANIPVVCVTGVLRREEVAEYSNERLADWMFIKQSFPEQLDKFLDAVAHSMAVSNERIHQRWKEIERQARAGD